MSQSPEELYKVIGQTVTACAPSGWSRIWIKAEMGDDTGQAEFDYEAASQIRTWFAPSTQEQYTIYQAFQGIKAAMVAAKQPPWKVALFTLERSGQFKLDFQYE